MTRVPNDHTIREMAQAVNDLAREEGIKTTEYADALGISYWTVRGVATGVNEGVTRKTQDALEEAFRRLVDGDLDDADPDPEADAGPEDDPRDMSAPSILSRAQSCIDQTIREIDRGIQTGNFRPLLHPGLERLLDKLREASDLMRWE